MREVYADGSYMIWFDRVRRDEDGLGCLAAAFHHAELHLISNLHVGRPTAH